MVYLQKMFTNDFSLRLRFSGYYEMSLLFYREKKSQKSHFFMI